MQLEFGAATDPGRQRAHNEDNFLIDPRSNLFIVADGMGGHACGEVASSLCVRSVRGFINKNKPLNNNRTEILQVLESALQSTCRFIYDRAQRNPETRGMGTTCSALMIVGDRGYMAHVGDSRLYLVRQNLVHQLSEDHSLINELIRNGRLRREEIDSSPYKDYKNAMTRAVGVYESVEIDLLDFDVLPGDQFLLCSDGLHGYLDDQSLLTLMSNSPTQSLPNKCIEFANQCGGQDNITSIVVRIGTAAADDTRVRDVDLQISVLQGMPIFKHLNYKELVHVLNITRILDTEDQSVVFNEGSHGHDLYIVLDGLIELRKNGTTVATLKRGDHFGEMSLIDNAARSASAIANGKSRMLVIARKDFFEILRHESKMSVKLLWSFVQVLGQRLRKTTADLSGTKSLEVIPDLTEDIFHDDD